MKKVARPYHHFTAYAKLIGKIRHTAWADKFILVAINHERIGRQG